MSYCINPRCPQPNDLANFNNRVCRHCGSGLLVQGRFQVMRLLSDNTGFGKIYEAYEGETPKILKVLKEDYNHNPKVIELFQQEADVLSRFNHPGLPKVEPDGYFQFQPRDHLEPVHCIIMEKVDGPNLKQWMQQGKCPISQRQALDWLRQLGEILHNVHQQNYFHRDIKPANIMVRSNGQLVLIDFGTAREMTYTYLAGVGGAGSITKISSAGYTPPEQEKGHAVPQSDFYALGRTFVYLLTGKQLTDREIYEPLTDECHWRNHAPDISPLLADFVDGLMAPQAARRPKNTQEILAGLDRITQALSPSKLLPHSSSGESSPLLLKTPFAPTKFNTIKCVTGAVAALVIGLVAYEVFHYYYTSEINANGNSYVVRTLAGHHSYVNALLISSDGQRLFSASADKTIKIWNLATGQELRTLSGHTSYVNALAVSPDGQRLFSASADKTIKIWNLVTGQELRTLTGHTSYINCLAISPDGQRLFSGSADKTVKIWNLTTGQELHTLVGHTSYVNALAVGPDGQTLVSGSADKTIKVWDLTTARELRTLIGHEDYVKSLAVNRDGQTLVSGSADKTIKIWSLLTGQEMFTLRGHESEVNTLGLSNDGQILFSASKDKTIKIWNLVTRQTVYTLSGHRHSVNTLVVSPDEQTIATGSGDKTIKIWQVPHSQ